ncbi:MAG: hypothetical protein BGO21_16975 [Dyadobacter sp. 50-39]|uniref:hypothetical protein n=1 Tax=Dyadobacter sp. 50-39 TaxID=1895756 RepID=UPI0009658A43|nr:hypothetical protein [Dyadobacter sp. 50-39]OJV14994.1 MAG: hypothetical protein BGO21_16975 [Dyadobacter sp. 50-39]
MEATIRCKILRHTHVFQPGNIVETRRRILEKSENQPESGYFIPDTGDGNPGIIPLDNVEPLGETTAGEEAYYGKCVLTGVSNFWKDADGKTGEGPAGIVKPVNVRVVHYPDCQQLVFHMPRYAWDAGTFRLTNACSQEIIEEKPVRERLNGGTMILTNTLSFPPGFYTIEADWPDGWTHRIQFIKFTEGYPKAPYGKAPANIFHAIRGDEVHLQPLPEEIPNPGSTESGIRISENRREREPDSDHSSPACSLHMMYDRDERSLDYTGRENKSEIDVEKFKKEVMGRFFPKLEYTQEGRGGSIYYMEGAIKIQFGWEFGGGNTVVIIFIPNLKYWEAQTGTPIYRRNEILQFLCEQVIRDQAAGCRYVMYEDSISIVR